MTQEEKDNIKSSYAVNSVILALVLGMMGIYHLLGARLLVYYSVFVAAVYLLNYLFISKYKLRLYIWATYTMLTLYMAICTIMLGYNYGFNLYAMSTIPLIYYVKYVSFKTGGKDPYPVFWTIMIIISCTLSSLYVVYYGPVYDAPAVGSYVFLGINTVTICLFLFVYSRKMFNMVTESEEKLDYQANHDALTGLVNRFYMRKVLIKAIETEPGENWIAMIDIDKFKSINDKYGHNAGDVVLKALGQLMVQVCSDCEVSRWGGEEFLIFGKSSAVSEKVIEKLRAAVEAAETVADGKIIKFTITSGVAVHEKGQQMDRWIITADNKLYGGKENGRNRVVF